MNGEKYENEKPELEHSENSSELQNRAEHQPAYDPAWEKKTMRKVDRRLVLILSGCYGK